MHVHLGPFAQLSQSGRSELKNANVANKDFPSMGIHWARDCAFVKPFNINCSLSIFAQSLSKNTAALKVVCAPNIAPSLGRMPLKMIRFLS